MTVLYYIIFYFIFEWELTDLACFEDENDEKKKDNKKR